MQAEFAGLDLCRWPAESTGQCVGEAVGAEAGGVGGQEGEGRVVAGQLGAPIEQAVEAVLEAPRRATAPVAVARRVEDDRVVPPAPPDLALDEGLDIVDEPADRPVGESGQLGVSPSPGDRWTGAVDVGDGRSGGRRSS